MASGNIIGVDPHRRRSSTSAALSRDRTLRQRHRWLLRSSRMGPRSRSRPEVGRGERSEPRVAPHSTITARTASKMRWGASETRSLLRHRVRTVGRNASSVNANPAAAFHAMSVCNARHA